MNIILYLNNIIFNSINFHDEIYNINDLEHQKRSKINFKMLELHMQSCFHFDAYPRPYFIKDAHVMSDKFYFILFL